MSDLALYVRQARWLRRIYAIPRKKLHKLIVMLPRCVHGVLDFPKTRLTEVR